MTMRSEGEIVERVLAVAGADDAVRAVIRTDLLPVREYLYTYNFIFVVDALGRFDGDVFGTCLGERILLYRADRSYPEMFPGAKAHLMVFRDGVTIVIHAMDRDAFLTRYNREDGRENVWMGDTYRKLMDKDGALPDIERMEERQTLFSDVPSEAAFASACDEFWWVMKTFAEYTLRRELPAAMFYLNVAVRDLLNRLLRWHIRLREGKPVDMGILDSNLEKLLEEEWFALYRRTYPCADDASVWAAFEAVAALWNGVGNIIAERRGFRYPSQTEGDMLAFIRNLREQEAGRKT